jgi:hypothetical protein
VSVDHQRVRIFLIGRIRLAGAKNLHRDLHDDARASAAG